MAICANSCFETNVDTGMLHVLIQVHAGRRRSMRGPRYALPGVRGLNLEDLNG